VGVTALAGHRALAKKHREIAEKLGDEDDEDNEDDEINSP
jgi:hypothetical protein